MKYNITVFLLVQFCFSGFTQQTWQSKFVKLEENHKLVYIPDDRSTLQLKKEVPRSGTFLIVKFRKLKI